MGKLSKTKLAKNIRKTPPTIPKPKPKVPSKLLSLLTPTKWFYAWLVLILTIVTAYYTFAFKLSITPSSQIVDNFHPFSTLFTLRNDSLLWINLVNPYECFLKRAKTANGGILTNCCTTRIKPSIPLLESGELTSFKPAFGIGFTGDQIIFADIEIIIHFYPALFPSYKFLEREYHQRFITYRAKDGTFHWEHKAKSE